VMIYDALRDTRNIARNVQAVKLALQALASMVPGGIVSTNEYTMKILLQSLEQTADSHLHVDQQNPRTLALPSEDDRPAIDSFLDNLPTPSDTFDAPSSFPAGWATFENGIDCNFLMEPGGFDANLLDIDWEFDKM
jgi:hypothetical protein